MEAPGLDSSLLETCTELNGSAEPRGDHSTAASRGGSLRAPGAEQSQAQDTWGSRLRAKLHEGHWGLVPLREPRRQPSLGRAWA